MAQIINAHCTFDFSIFKNAIVVIGVFDGVHLGHQKLINNAIKHGKDNNKRIVVATFNIDPDELFNPDKLYKIQSNADRIKALRKMDVNSVAVLNFDTSLSNMEPKQFLSHIFLHNLPYAIHVGSDFKFGKSRSGNVETLKEWGKEREVEIIIEDLITDNGKKISSTRIRDAYLHDNLNEANRLLGDTIK